MKKYNSCLIFIIKIGYFNIKNKNNFYYLIQIFKIITQFFSLFSTLLSIILFIFILLFSILFSIYLLVTSNLYIKILYWLLSQF